MKTKIKNKAMAIFMTLAMAFTMMPIMANVAYADEPYNLWVGGVQVTSSNLFGTGWSYDANTNTLTLNNANITEGYEFATGYYCGIYYGGNTLETLNIVLEGSNRIMSPQGAVSFTCGIFCPNAHVTISGSGTVKVSGTEAGIKTSGKHDIKISGGSVTASGDNAIYAGRNVEISGGTVKAIATGSNGNAIYALNYVDLKGGNVTASGAGTGCGIFARGIDKIDKSVIIWAGDDESNATDVTAEFQNNYKDYKWVCAETCTLWVGGFPVTGRNVNDILGDLDEGATASYDDNTKTLTLNNYSYESEGYRFDADNNFYAAIYADRDLNIKLEGDNTVKCKEIDSSVGFGIYSNGKALTISGDGTLTTTGYGHGGIGIFTESEDITINGGTVTVSGHNAMSANGGNIIINGGIVTASGSNDKGFSADNVKIGNDMGVNAGENEKAAIAVDREDFVKNHPQEWVQVAKAYQLWVGDKQVLTANASNITGGATVTARYDEKSNTLTLDNYNYSGTGTEHTNGNFAIFNEVDGKDFTVKLDGENTLEITSTNDYDYGIHHDSANSAVNFTGNGSLNIVCKDANSTNYGIDSIGNVVIDGPSLNIDAGNKGYGIGCAAGINVSIKSGSLTAKGGKGAIYLFGGGTVKNSIAGLGWTDMAGTEGKTYFAVNTEGQAPNESIKHVKFPAPTATVTTEPQAKTPDASGSAQELVTAGEAENGEMQYALGIDETTVPTDGWSTSVPKGTDAGDYYVWYKAVGDSIHADSDAVCVKVHMHGWKDATCTEAKTCEVCGATEGDPFGHRWELSENDVVWTEDSSKKPGDPDYYTKENVKGIWKCSNDSSHIHEGTAKEITVNALTQPGEWEYHAVFESPENGDTVTIIKKVVMPTYTILEGADQTYTIGSGVDVVIKADGDLAKLDNIEFDGTALAKGVDYDVVSGSTILTLKSGFLNKQSVGNHTVRFVYNDGIASTSLKVANAGGKEGGQVLQEVDKNKPEPLYPESPQTSDNNHIAGLSILVILSALGMAAVAIADRKKLWIK